MDTVKERLFNHGVYMGKICAKHPGLYGLRIGKGQCLECQQVYFYKRSDLALAKAEQLKWETIRALRIAADDDPELYPMTWDELIECRPELSALDAEVQKTSPGQQEAEWYGYGIPEEHSFKYRMSRLVGVRAANPTPNDRINKLLRTMKAYDVAYKHLTREWR